MLNTLPVKGANGRWLPPCSRARARQLLKAGYAVRRTAPDTGAYLQLKVAAVHLTGTLPANAGVLA